MKKSASPSPISPSAGSRISPATASRWATTANAPAASGSRPTSAPPASASPAVSSTTSSPNSNPSASIPDTTDTLRHCVLKRAGLCLVTGPTGSGKSTTLASLIDWLRRNHPKHIVTVEDPIEYQYPDDMDDPDYPGHRIPSPSIVTQQEVGRDVHSYRQGLKDVLRKAPHIILLGEIRDREAMETCMEAAQTGHLVLSTLHTTGAVKTIGRILELYPKESHTAVLSRLAEILIFIHSQGLLNGVQRRVLTYEFLQNNDDAVSSAIANYDGGARSLEDVIRRAGNIEWDANLRRLLNQGLITPETFINARMNKNDDEVESEPSKSESRVRQHLTHQLFLFPTLTDFTDLFQPLSEPAKRPRRTQKLPNRQAVSLRQNTTHPNKTKNRIHTMKLTNTLTMKRKPV